MNKEEAHNILDGIINQYKKKSYEELDKLINGDIGCFAVTGDSGQVYEVEIDIFRSKRHPENIRFDAVLNTGILSSLFPMRGCFIKNPQNEFVEEDYEEPLF